MDFLTQSEENYLKEIYSLESELNSEVTTNLIADKIKTKASSVTDMLQRLASKNLVSYTKYKGTRLSEDGRAIAISIVRKHRLWETFLVNKLGFQWDQVHCIAEQLEHIKSEQLTNRLDEFLEFPKFDPHGDPIPNMEYKVQQNTSIPLAELSRNEEGVLVAVKDSSDNFLKYLSEKDIALGDTIKVLEIETFDNSYKIESKANQHVVSELVAKNLYLDSL
jgi:DtxR family Mn-dependent transcriptional regulator